ncbi:alginate O-acetyltransferase [Clostridium tertium]|uniref:alginate O-acetyltransferase n=1 Tax=Clostridium TaxID=1485 RepID=UPI000DD01897|nr:MULTISPECIES: alginate O-acetyltransferase [Clostridium]MDB1953680.1 alginate O-acetyltransferase [Clostridium tertium]MDB1957636.1 alginate O-acetyltransferase [Clostridium tertium]MDB1962133.1 alginate O-acetyltransferase [Clostridium tertium]MDB1964510.1 alginate O-acetyltransferase [Clostridium tertium]MDU1278868.1 alginate O-acetyltransferase [Clostridium sp.]
MSFFKKDMKLKNLNSKDVQFIKINNLIKIGAFFLVILIPILFMNFKRDQVSKIDNRMLLNFEDIFSNKDIFNNIESYIDDRIGFRTEMVDIYAKVMDKAFNEITHPKYEYGKDGFIMSKAEENEFNPEFMETYSDFIKEFQDYCNARDIKFLYSVEPRKELIYPEYITEGYNYENRDIEYFLELLEEKNINYLNNIETLSEAREKGSALDILKQGYRNSGDTETVEFLENELLIIDEFNELDKSNVYLENEYNKNSKKEIVDSRGLLYDKEYDARHWNETGAIIGISAILDRLNLLDNRVETFDISKYEAKDYINDTLVASNFEINEITTKYNLIEDNSIYIEDLEDEIKRHESFSNFTHYKNEANPNAPRILIFAGSYFDDKEKFLTESFSELMKIHNYRNVLDYEYYINIFNPDIVLFESTEYTHFDFYFPDDEMEDKIHIKNLKNYKNLKEDNFVVTELNNLSNHINCNNITNFSIKIDSEDVLFAYAYINNRILDCKINEIDNQKYVEFSIMTSEIKDLNEFDLYFISKDEERYQKISCRLN